MIRQIEPSEVSLTRELAFAFFEASGLPGQLNFDHWVGRWQNIIEIGLGTIFVYFDGEGVPVGLLGGICAQCMMTADMEAIEAFWFVDPKFRGAPVGIKLLKAFEKWSQQRGAKRVKMMHLVSLNPDLVRSLYLRMGYQQLETAYSKELCQP